MRDRPADRIVILSIVLVLLAGDMLLPGPAMAGLAGWLGRHGDLLATLAIGAAVGFAELVSRYRDAPWQVAAMLPGRIFIAINAAVAGLALFLLTIFAEELHAPKSPVMRDIIAGTGAMVLVRSKLFTLRQPGGGDIAVGPAIMLDALLSAVNREADRRRAERRVARVAARARAFAHKPYHLALGYLTASLGAFQNLDAEVTQKLGDDLNRLDDDKVLGKLEDEVKYLIAGYAILTEIGDTAFEAIFTRLETYLLEPRP